MVFKIFWLSSGLEDNTCIPGLGVPSTAGTEWTVGSDLSADHLKDCLTAELPEGEGGHQASLVDHLVKRQPD